MSQLVVGAIIVDSLAGPTKLLAARRSRPPDLAGRWEFPGGKVEAGETPQEALVRELREELGVEILVGDELASPTGHWPIDDALRLRLFFAEIVDGAVTPGEAHDAVRWLGVDALPSVAWLPADDQALEAVAHAMTREL